MVKLSKNLHILPKISFTAGYQSIYTFKTEPQEDFISTIETCYYLLKELRAGEFSTTLTQPDFDPEPLMNIFKKMITTQLESQHRREESGEPDRYQLAGSLRAKKRALREQQN
jgi:DTW domain-containing protein YfiP